VLIFAHHKVMIGVIEEVVKTSGIKYIKITGDTPTVKRQALVDQFQTDPETRVAVLSLTAAGMGLNLQAASIVIFTEIFFGPDTMIQAEDRSHRMGQKAARVECRYLIAKETLDESLMRMVQRKTAASALMVEGRRATFDMQRSQHLALPTDDAAADTAPTEQDIEAVALEQLCTNPDLEPTA
jgi:SNF2 family DNA or RNA helicase